MKKCIKCDISYTDDKKFCKKCGSPLSQEYNIDPKELAKKTVYEEKLKADSLNTDLLLEYSQFLYNNLLFKEAVPNLLKILAIDENQKQVNELLFKCYSKLSMYSEAQDIGKQLLKSNKTDIFLLEELANIETQLDNKTKATEYYETILKIQPTNTKALYNKANSFIENNELEKAISIFKELYKDGDRDRITVIYAGIDKCLSGSYNDAIDILEPYLSENDISYSDFHNQRGILYLTYSLCKTQKQFGVINKWIYKVDFNSFKKNQHVIDEEIIGKSILEMTDIYFTRNYEQTTTSIDKYITASSVCITEHNKKCFAEAWFKVSDFQVLSELFIEAQFSLKRATELSPETTEYSDKLKHVTALLEQQDKKRKRKTITIVASITTFIILIIVSVILYLSYMENKTWEQANQQNTVAAYDKYITSYPDGKYITEAKELREETFWQAAVTANSNQQNNFAAYDKYITSYPNGKYITEAKELREETFWQAAVTANSLELFYDYYQQYPDGKHIKIFPVSNESGSVYGTIKFIGNIDKTTNKGYGIGIYEPNNKWSGVYRGEWLNEKMHGFGTMKWDVGDSYEGNWKNGWRTGFGKYYWANGDRYEGNWYNNKMHGFGKYFWTNGKRFEGNWVNDDMGDGEYYYD